MTDSNRRISHAALVAALISSPVFAASDPAAIEQQLHALQQALGRQQEQLAQQQQQEIERLRQQVAASSSDGAAVEHVADEVQQAKLAAQDALRVTSRTAPSFAAPSAVATTPVAWAAGSACSARRKPK